MANTIQHKRGSSANWTSTDPTLAAGEFGFETDTGKLKVGDGSTAWSALGYFAPAPPPSYTITPNPSSVDEGNILTFNIGGENITDGTYYWTIESNAGDFTTTNGSFNISNNDGSFTVTPTADSTTEGDETFEVAIRISSITGTILQTSSTAIINDTSITASPMGQEEYTSAGTYSWTAPAGVTAVSVVAVGAGGYNAGASNGPVGGGGGGALVYKNNIAVTPGQIYTVVVGNSPNGGTGGISSFTAGFGTMTAGGGGGNAGFNTPAPNGGAGGLPSGTYDAGYAGGAGGSYSSSTGFGGGGGAGGYSGVGGYGGSNGAAGSNGSGGGGGGGGSASGYGGTKGGGVGILGQGSNGTGASGSGHGGAGSNGAGVQYGGGGTAWNGGYSALGGKGAIRIIWGDNRAFPSTNTGDL